MKNVKYKYVLYLIILSLSTLFLTGCTKDSDVTETETKTEEESIKPNGEVEIIGNIPDEVVQNIKDGWADTYTDVVAKEIGMSLPDYYMVEVSKDGYTKIQSVDDRIKEIIVLINKNGIDYESVNILLGFTQESEVPGWERAYHLQMWIKYEGVDEYSLNISELVAPEDHPVMLD